MPCLFFVFFNFNYLKEPIWGKTYQSITDNLGSKRQQKRAVVVVTDVVWIFIFTKFEKDLIWCTWPNNELQHKFELKFLQKLFKIAELQTFLQLLECYVVTEYIIFLNTTKRKTQVLVRICLQNCESKTNPKTSTLSSMLDKKEQLVNECKKIGLGSFFYKF